MVNVDVLADVLSAPQRDVLALSATGLITAEVAAALQMSIDEVRAHIRGAILRLGAQSKLEAVLIAFRHGLIPLPSD
jgi:DNA-binding CsgD family transcriptional regulator